jgi:ABC-type arginine transport system ATPase subunit
MSNTPYPGLRPFRSDEAGIFFGREAQVDALLEKLDHFRFLAVIGPSGCGKSSLVRAGMIPALETGLLARAGVRWQVATMRPGERPLRRLAEALGATSALGLNKNLRPWRFCMLLCGVDRGV